MTSDYIPGHVYNNLIKMHDYRGITLDQPALAPDDVVQKLNHYEFLSWTGKRKDITTGEIIPVIFFLIAPNSKYATKSGDFVKFFKNIPSTKRDIIFVSEKEFTIHISKKIASYRVENPDVHVESHTYNIFMIETPKHVLVPQHIIPPAEEVEEFCRNNYVRVSSFPKILQSDPIAVWIGLRPGMVVKIIRLSETAGIAHTYRICI